MGHYTRQQAFGFHLRTGQSAADKAHTDFTNDTSYHAVDFSSVIGQSAKLVGLMITMQDGVSNTVEIGPEESDYQIMIGNPTVANIYYYPIAVAPIAGTGTIGFKFNTTAPGSYTVFTVTVLWWVE